MSLQVWLPLNGNLNNQGLSGVTFTNEGTISVDTSGKIGSCYSRATKQTSGRIISNSKVLFDKSLSICCWAYVSDCVGDTANGLVTIHSHEHNSNVGITVKQYSSADYRISCNTGMGNDRTYCTYYGSTNIKNTWSHLSLTYDKASKVLKLYVNGNCEYTLNNYTNYAISDNIILFDWSTTYNNPAYRPACKLNDVRIYDHCLSAKEVKEISKGLVCHYKLDNKGFGNPNLCNPSLGEFTGVVPTSSYKDFLERRAITTVNANDTYILSYYAKSNIDNVTLTNHLYNNASSIVQVSYSVNSDGYTSSRSDGYSLVKLTTSYKKYWVKWVFNSTSTSATKDLLFRLQSELNTSSAGATVTIKNVKLERGSVATPWCPHTSDSLYTSLGLDSTTEVDCSGYNYNGTKIGGLSSSTSPASVRYESCYDFDGNTGSIQIPNLSTLAPSGEFTMNCWIYHDNTWSSKICETILGGPSGFELNAKNRSTNSPALWTYSWGQGSATYELNKWNMITMTRNASETKFYINGELKITGSAGTIPSGDYFIGAWRSSGEQNFKGKISDFRLYSNVLSVEDIKELYNAPASIDKNGNMYAYEFKEE